MQKRFLNLLAVVYTFLTNVSGIELCATQFVYLEINRFIKLFYLHFLGGNENILNNTLRAQQQRVIRFVFSPFKKIRNENF